MDQCGCCPIPVSERSKTFHVHVYAVCVCVVGCALLSKRVSLKECCSVSRSVQEDVSGEDGVEDDALSELLDNLLIGVPDETTSAEPPTTIDACSTAGITEEAESMTAAITTTTIAAEGTHHTPDVYTGTTDTDPHLHSGVSVAPSRAPIQSLFTGLHELTHETDTANPQAWCDLFSLVFTSAFDAEGVLHSTTTHTDVLDES